MKNFARILDKPFSVKHGIREVLDSTREYHPGR